MQLAGHRPGQRNAPVGGNLPTTGGDPEGQEDSMTKTDRDGTPRVTDRDDGGTHPHWGWGNGGLGGGGGRGRFAKAGSVN